MGAFSMKELGDEQFIDDFLAGQIACQEGVKPTGDESTAWLRGWSTEYAVGEAKSGRATERERDRK